MALLRNLGIIVAELCRWTYRRVREGGTVEGMRRELERRGHDTSNIPDETLARWVERGK